MSPGADEPFGGDRHDETTCARPPADPPSTTEPLVPPVQLASVFRVAGLDEIDALYAQSASGFIYARDANPNAAQLAAKVAALEGAEAAAVTASGMSALSATLLSLVGNGGHVALSDGLYGKTSTLVVRELSRFGVGHAMFDPTRPETLRSVMTAETRVAIVETISNPLLRVADLPGLAEVAHSAGAALVVDHTFAPLLCRPIAHGADAVVHSLTKLMAGHSDVVLGVVAGTQTFIERASSLASTFGMTGTAFESWLALRGLSTLAVRSARACASALDLAERLSRHPRVRAVVYPGLPSHPDHARATELLKGGFGTIVTIDLGGRDEADRFIRRLRHIPFAPSLGDVSTTLSHPATTSHRGLTAADRERLGITPGMIRLSFGIEHCDDLWDDFEHALRPS